MIDPEAKRTILQSKIPSTIDSHQVIVDLISETYINETINGVFFDGTKDIQQISKIARLSLSSSILDDSSRNSFLVGECEEILYEINQAEGIKDISDFVLLSEIAAHYHISYYDANAAIIAKDIDAYLNSLPKLSETKKIYYQNYSNFLQGVFFLKSTVSPQETSTEDKIYLFLIKCLFELMSFYEDGIPYNVEIYQKLIKLEEVLSKNNPYWAAAIELSHIKSFYNLAKDKALKPKLQELRLFPKEYIESVKYPFLWPSTKEFLDKYFVEGCRHAVVNTPTGSGKSFFSELTAASVFPDGWVLYLAPTNALCSQVSKELKNNLHAVINDEISVVFGREEYSSMKFNRKKVFVTTPEKALIFTKLYYDDFKNCSLVVLDECHILADGKRGITSEIVLSIMIDRNPNIKILLMSALIKNTSDLSNWLQTVTNGQVGVVSNDWNPTRIARFMVSLDEKSKIICADGSNYFINLAIHADTESPWNKDTSTVLEWVLPIQLKSKRYGNELPFANDAARLIAQKICDNGLRTLIFVVRNKHHVFSMGNKWESSIANDFAPNEFEQALINICGFELGVNSEVCTLLIEKGVAVHSSAMLDSEKKLSISMYKREDSPIQTFIATGTLSQGMNLDIDAVIVTGTDRYSNDLINRVEHEILNAMGRAARANYSIHGMSFIVPTSPLREISFKKEQLIERSTCIHKIDASTVIESKLAKCVADFNESEEISGSEEEMLSLLPSDYNSMRNTLSRSWGIYKSSLEELDIIVDRAKQIHNLYSEKSYVPLWLYESASIASLPPEVAIQVYHGLVRSTSPPMDDTYLSWALFLIDLLAGISLPISRNIFSAQCETMLNKKCKLPGEKEKIIRSLKTTITQWLAGGNYSNIGNTSIRDMSTEGQWKRTPSRYHILPVVFKWINFVPSNLSRIASLLYSIQEKWLENEDKTMDELPVWLIETRVLSTLSLGIKNGVNSPEALSCYESIIPERLISNLLAQVAQLELKDPSDIDIRNRYAYRIKKEISENNEKSPFGQSILSDLRNYMNHHAQNH
jgi:hypothetical protein